MRGGCESGKGSGDGSSSDDDSGMISDVSRKLARSENRVRRSLYCEQKNPLYRETRRKKINQTYDGILQLQLFFLPVRGCFVFFGLFGSPDGISLFS